MEAVHDGGGRRHKGHHQPHMPDESRRAPGSVGPDRGANLRDAMEEKSSTVVKPEVMFLEDLFKDIAAGKLRIPKFQRPFVWKPDDMLSLFDSIRRGYPIGTLLLWNTAEKVQSLEGVGPLKIPKSEIGRAHA